MNREQDYGTSHNNSSSIRRDLMMAPNSEDDADDVPIEATNPEHVDSLIAKQMSSVSALEREMAYLDVHGIPNLAQIEETPELLQISLTWLQEEIESLQWDIREAYDLALSMNKMYVHNNDFLLAFLRADLFDAKKAATRLARHFQLKLKLFGKEKLAVDITQDDLNKEDMEVLYSGTGQWVPTKDRAGRMINVILTGHDHSTISLLRRAYYNLMIPSFREPDFQKKGYVVVTYSLDSAGGRGIGREKNSNYKLPKIAESAPVRIAAVHICHDKTHKPETIAMAKAGLNSSAQLRIRLHYGTHDEVLSKLQGHGIERGVIPIAEGGNITNAVDHRRRMAELRCTERRTQPQRRIIHVPGEHDVLFGKGSPFQNHPGNVSFRSMVVNFHEKFSNAEKGKKMIVAQEIVDMIHQNSGVFLRPEGDVWVVVENNVARNKVSTAFRTLRNMDRNKRLAL